MKFSSIENIFICNVSALFTCVRTGNVAALPCLSFAAPLKQSIAVLFSIYFVIALKSLL